MSTQPQPRLTPEEYLELERKAEYKSEHYQGEMFAMPGAPRARTVAGLLYPSDMRVLIDATGLYTYPDLVVGCGELRFRTTEAYDRGRKFEHYRSIYSLAQYVMIASDRVSAELYTRQPDGVLTAKTGRDDVLHLQLEGCRLSLSDVYEKVEFAA